MPNLFYVNVSESEFRSWDDCKKYGFMAAGGNTRRIAQISSLNQRDVVVAYLSGKPNGYVGVGTVEEKAVPIENFLYNGVPLSNFKLTQPGIFKRSGQHEVCDHLIKVNWEIAVDRHNAKWEKGLYASQNVRTSLTQPTTIEFLESEFKISFQDLLDRVTGSIREFREELAEEIITSNNDVLIEGAKKVLVINSYERNRKARAACIKHYGIKCQVCDIDFSKRYGEIGKDFIHVHHLVKLADIGKSYRLNPKTDLIPVCPNCHSMLHRTDPPLSIAALKSMLK